MSGNREGGLKAAQANIKKYGEDFYRRIGQQGGSKGAKDGARKGFANRPYEQVAEAGRRGGIISRRTKKGASK